MNNQFNRLLLDFLSLSSQFRFCIMDSLGGKYGNIKKSNKDYNQTIIMITHNPEIAKMTDRIIEIEDGHIKEER